MCECEAASLQQKRGRSEREQQLKPEICCGPTWPSLHRKYDRPRVGYSLNRGMCSLKAPVCLPACCKLLLTLTRLLQISCRFGKVLSESCPFSWESAKISTPLPDDRPKSKEASPFCCTWAAFSRVSESIVPVDGGRLVATAEASQTTRLYPETRPRRGGRPELVSDTRPPLSSLSAM